MVRPDLPHRGPVAGFQDMDPLQDNSGEEAPDSAESAAPAARTTPEAIRRPTGIAVCQNHRRDPRTLVVIISMML